MELTNVPTIGLGLVKDETNHSTSLQCFYTEVNISILL